MSREKEVERSREAPEMRATRSYFAAFRELMVKISS